MTSKKSSLFYLHIVCFTLLALTPLMAWETPVVIAGKGGHSYEKPELVFGPSGRVFVTYRDKVGSTSEIFLYTDDGKKSDIQQVSNMAILWDKYKAYEANLAVDADETVHIAWVGHDKNDVVNQTVYYRSKSGNAWSDIVVLGELSLPKKDDYCADLRVAVDNRGNAHVIVFKHEEKTTWYMAKYGDTIVSPRKVGPGGAWVKNPDIVVDDQNIHVLWQQKMGFPYQIIYQRWDNAIDGARDEARIVTEAAKPYAFQKPRIALDPYGVIHRVDFYKTGEVKDVLYYQMPPGGTFSDDITVSSPDGMALYHLPDIAVRENSLIITFEKGGGGKGIYYNWQRDGVWGGYTKLPELSFAPSHQSVDLSPDGEIAAITYTNTNQVVLSTSAPIDASGVLETEFTPPTQVFWGSEMTFDASQCTGLNPDYNIVQYTWDFGDGNIETTTSPTIAHTYNIYDATVEVKLTITAETGEAGETSIPVEIHALYGGVLTDIIPHRIRTLFYNRYCYELRWDDNPKNEAAGYPSVTNYEIWRAMDSATLSDSDFIKLGEVGGGFTKFLDYFDVREDVTYVYAIRARTAEGYLSPFNRL